ncbi:MAG: class I adenylate-forming enzyme family protein [Hyphomonadaceae bacterium]|nr:class I adenylate-forming enzyme family protein [Hyphomonadaceae bacterium]
MLAHELLIAAAAEAPDKVALRCGARDITFAELDRDSSALAGALQRLGVERGDRVATLTENSVEMVLALWAAWKAGAVLTPLNHATRAQTLAAVLRDAEPRVLIVQPQMAARVEEALADAPAPVLIWSKPHEGGVSIAELIAAADMVSARRIIDEDLALLIYTSGSTGAPKGVMLTHRTVCNNAGSIAAYLQPRAHDVVLCVLPLSFGYGLFQLLTAALARHEVVLESNFAFPQDLLKQIVARGVTGFPSVPTIFGRLIELIAATAPDLSRLRYITNAAAPMPTAHIERLRALLPHVDIYSMYGLTECTRAAYLEPQLIDLKPGSVGKAMPNCEALVLNEAGKVCAPGEIGELVIRGANVMRGYWRRPEETAKVLRPFGPAGGLVLHTGDLFRTDEDGDLYFVGRIDDVFKCRGEKVSPKEVEGALYELNEVAEAAVIGVPDPIDGMAVKAFIVVRAGAELSEQTVRRHCKARLPTWLAPKFIEFCEGLPKTETGKVVRKPLRETAAAK